MTTPVGSRPANPIDATQVEVLTPSTRSTSSNNLAQATRSTAPAVFQGLTSSGNTSADPSVARRSSYSMSSARPATPVREPSEAASHAYSGQQAPQTTSGDVGHATGIVRPSPTSATIAVTPAQVSNDAAEWSKPLGTLKPEKVVRRSLLAFKDDARLPHDALQKLEAKIMDGNLSLWGHPEQKGARSSVELSPGTSFDGQPAPRWLGFQMQPINGSDKWFLSAVSVRQEGKPLVIIVSPELLNNVDRASMNPASKQILREALAANKPSSTGLSEARNALPSPDYLEKHGLPLDELIPETSGPTHDQLKTVLRRLASKGKIDVPKSEIDSASREQRVEWVKEHADKNGGHVMLDMVGFLMLPPQLTWETSHRAFDAGSAYHGTDGKSVGGKISGADEQLMGELEEAERSGDISEGQYLRYANGLAQNLGFNVAPRTADDV
jgi:hypothetical protein